MTIFEVPSGPDALAFRRACARWQDTLDAEALVHANYIDRQASTRAAPRP